MRLKILSIGSDRNLLKKDSDSQKRIIDHGKLFDELHIVVFADKKLGFSDLKLEENIFIYPTNHRYKIFYLWDIYKIVRKLLRVSGQFSAITAQDPFESGLAGWLLKLWLKIPLQLQIHTDIFSTYFSGESFTNKLRTFLAKFLLTRADRIRVVSERIKQSIIIQLPNYNLPISVLPVFVDVKKIQSAKIKINLHEKYPNHDFIILMASRLTQEKNIGMAIEAFEGVIKKISHSNSKLPKNPLLLIVGDGPESESLKLKVVSSKLENNVRFESFVDSATLFSYYKTADLFLLTSNYEGYGRTVIEAMSAGLPTIMTDVGIAGDILIDDLDGFVVPINKSAILAEIIIKLIYDQDRLASIRSEAQRVLRDFPSKPDYLNSYKKSFLE